MAARLGPDPLRSLNATSDFLAVVGKIYGNKGKKQGEKGKEKKGKVSCAPTKFL